MNGDNSLDWSYDPECDALFIHRVDDYEYEESIEMRCDVLMDFDTLLNPSAICKVLAYGTSGIVLKRTVGFVGGTLSARAALLAERERTVVFHDSRYQVVAHVSVVADKVEEHESHRACLAGRVGEHLQQVGVEC